MTTTWLVRVRVPPSAQPGDEILVKTTSGKKLRANVPQAMKPNGILSMRTPLAANSDGHAALVVTECYVNSVLIPGDWGKPPKVLSQPPAAPPPQLPTSPPAAAPPPPLSPAPAPPQPPSPAPSSIPSTVPPRTSSDDEKPSAKRKGKTKPRAAAKAEMPEDEFPVEAARAAAANPERFRRGMRVRVWWDAETDGRPLGWVRGSIIDLKSEMEVRFARGGLLHEIRVEHDDGDVKWIKLDGSWAVERLTSDSGAAGSDEVVEENDSERTEELKLTCQGSGEPLTEPAKGKACRHLAVFNYRYLSRHVTKAKNCPYATCHAKLVRPSDLERDAWLADELKKLSKKTAVAKVWLKEDASGERTLLTKDPNAKEVEVVEIDDDEEEEQERKRLRGLSKEDGIELDSE